MEHSRLFITLLTLDSCLSGTKFANIRLKDPATAVQTNYIIIR